MFLVCFGKPDYLNKIRNKTYLNPSIGTSTKKWDSVI